MNLIQSFIYGGTIVSIINYIANTMVNPALASIIAAVPIGMVSMYFLKEGNICDCFSRNYIVTGIVQIIAALFLYMLLIYYKINKTYAASASIFLWFSLQMLRYLFLKNYYPTFLYP